MTRIRQVVLITYVVILIIVIGFALGLIVTHL